MTLFSFFFYRISESCEGYSGADLKALVTKASEVCFSEGKEMEKAGKSKSKKVTKTHFAQALTAIRPSVSGKEKTRYEKTRLDLMPHHFHEKNTSSLPPAVIQKSIPNFINNEESIVTKTTRESLLESPHKSAASEPYKNPVKESQNSAKESISNSTKEALQTFKFQKIVTEPVKEAVKEPVKEMVLPGIFSGKKFTYVKETSQESIEESIQESVEKCLQSTKKINSTDDSEHNKGTGLFFFF